MQNAASHVSARGHRSRETRVCRNVEVDLFYFLAAQAVAQTDAGVEHEFFVASLCRQHCNDHETAVSAVELGPIPHFADGGECERTECPHPALHRSQNALRLGVGDKT